MIITNKYIAIACIASMFFCGCSNTGLETTYIAVTTSENTAAAYTESQTIANSGIGKKELISENETVPVKTTDTSTEYETETIPVAEKNEQDTETVSTAADEESTTPIDLTEEQTLYDKKVDIYFSQAWEFAEFSEIHSGYAVLYYAKENRKNIVLGINAGHGTVGGEEYKTYCHPDKTEKTTGGSTDAGSLKAFAVGKGTTFYDGTPEAVVTLQIAQILKNMALDNGYDVLMIRDGDDVQLDNVARTIMCNNNADCHISLHWDEDGMNYDKGCFYLSVPSSIRDMYPVSTVWKRSNALGENLICGLKEENSIIWENGNLDEDLTQTSYSTIPSISIELGNQASDHSEEALNKLAKGLLSGINYFFE